jgi:hypothetical protein
MLSSIDARTWLCKVILKKGEARQRKKIPADFVDFEAVNMREGSRSQKRLQSNP